MTLVLDFSSQNLLIQWWGSLHLGVCGSIAWFSGRWIAMAPLKCRAGFGSEGFLSLNLLRYHLFMWNPVIWYSFCFKQLYWLFMDNTKKNPKKLGWFMSWNFCCWLLESEVWQSESLYNAVYSLFLTVFRDFVGYYIGKKSFDQ